jgi:hypothetical protein
MSLGVRTNKRRSGWVLLEPTSEFPVLQKAIRIPLSSSDDAEKPRWLFLMADLWISADWHDERPGLPCGTKLSHGKSFLSEWLVLQNFLALGKSHSFTAEAQTTQRLRRDMQTKLCAFSAFSVPLR